jgi:hypothetical protein
MQRVRLILAFSVIFALVVISKSLIWHFSVQRLEQALLMTKTSCTESSSQDFTWLQRNPYNIINNWALPTLALIIQDDSPRKLLLEKGDCNLFYESGAVKIDPWTSISKNLLVPSLS